MKLDGGILNLTTKENPHRRGTKDFKKWNALSASKATRAAGISVADAVASGCEKSYIRYLVRRGLAKLASGKTVKGRAR